MSSGFKTLLGQAGSMRGLRRKQSEMGGYPQSSNASYTRSGPGFNICDMLRGHAPMGNPPSSGVATRRCLALLGVDFHVPCLVLEGLELVLQLAARKSIKPRCKHPCLKANTCHSGRYLFSKELG